MKTVARQVLRVLLGVYSAALLPAILVSATFVLGHGTPRINAEAFLFLFVYLPGLFVAFVGLPWIIAIIIAEFFAIRQIFYFAFVGAMAPGVMLYGADVYEALNPCVEPYPHCLKLGPFFSAKATIWLGMLGMASGLIVYWVSGRFSGIWRGPNVNKQGN